MGIFDLDFQRLIDVSNPLYVADNVVNNSIDGFKSFADGDIMGGINSLTGKDGISGDLDPFQGTATGLWDTLGFKGNIVDDPYQTLGLLTAAGFGGAAAMGGGATGSTGSTGSLVSGGSGWASAPAAGAGESGVALGATGTTGGVGTAASGSSAATFGSSAPSLTQLPNGVLVANNAAGAASLAGGAGSTGTTAGLFGGMTMPQKIGLGMAGISALTQMQKNKADAEYQNKLLESQEAVNAQNQLNYEKQNFMGYESGYDYNAAESDLQERSKKDPSYRKGVELAMNKIKAQRGNR